MLIAVLGVQRCGHSSTGVKCRQYNSYNCKGREKLKLFKLPLRYTVDYGFTVLVAR